MKSQGLPMTTIVLIIIVLVVLAGVLLFFFTYFSKSQGGVDSMNCFQLCQVEKANWENAKKPPVNTDTQFCIKKCTGLCYYNSTNSFSCT